MNKLFLGLVAVGLTAGASAIALAGAAEGPPMWAWGYTTPADPAMAPLPPAPSTPAAAPDTTTQISISGSKYQFSPAQISARFAPADWFPEDHPQMPEVVAHGRESANPPVWACGMCHMPNGKGRPENADLTGLPADYILQQLMDFKNDRRTTSDKRKTNTGLMVGFAKSMTREEMEAAAHYFSSITPTPWTKVIESDTAPKTVARGGVFLTITGKDAGMEPLGNRIVETPISAEDFEVKRNPRSGFLAYVPKGSLKKGETLVRGGKTLAGKQVTACTVCHGPDLRGLGPVPPLAGRSPSYIARQMYDMQHGARTGTWSPLMAPVLSNLTNDDLLVAAAYLGSLDR